MAENDSQSDPQSEFQNFEEKIKQLQNTDFSDQSQYPHIEEMIVDACKSIQKIHSKIPDNFITESQIISFLQHMITTFNENPPIFEKISILFFYVINGSKRALIDFVSIDPKEYILRLFYSENLKERHICYEILIRLNDPSCKNIVSQNSCKDLDLYPQIIERTEDILRKYPLQDPAYSAYNTNIQALLKVILEFTNIIQEDALLHFKDNLFFIFDTIMSYPDDEIRVSYSKYVLYSLFFLSKNPFYIEIISSGLFAKAMQYIEYVQTASFTILLSIQMLQVSIENGEYEQDIKSLLPIKQSYDIFMSTNDYQLLKYVLTLYTNSICFDVELTEVLATEPFLNRLNALMQDENVDIQQRTIWCIWNMLRFGELQVLTNILSFEELREILVDLSFEMEDISFVKSVLVPSILKISKSIASIKEQEPYSTFMDSLIQPLKDLCYKEGSPEVMCLAASCLKFVFPDEFKNENFNNE